MRAFMEALSKSVRHPDPRLPILGGQILVLLFTMYPLLGLLSKLLNSVSLSQIRYFFSFSLA